jgi:hypothetical protein
MFTIKYTDQDGYERLTQGEDIRVTRDGRHAKTVSWLGCGTGHQINFATTAYVMNESGATVAKYVVLSDPKNPGE